MSCCVVLPPYHWLVHWPNYFVKRGKTKTEVGGRFARAKTVDRCQSVSSYFYLTSPLIFNVYSTRRLYEQSRDYSLSTDKISLYFLFGVSWFKFCYKHAACSFSECNLPSNCGHLAIKGKPLSFVTVELPAKMSKWNNGCLDVPATQPFS